MSYDNSEYISSRPPLHAFYLSPGADALGICRYPPCTGAGSPINTDASCIPMQQRCTSPRDTRLYSRPPRPQKLSRKANQELFLKKNAPPSHRRQNIGREACSSRKASWPLYKRRTTMVARSPAEHPEPCEKRPPRGSRTFCGVGEKISKRQQKQTTLLGSLGRKRGGGTSSSGHTLKSEVFLGATITSPVMLA